MMRKFIVPGVLCAALMGVLMCALAATKSPAAPAPAVKSQQAADTVKAMSDYLASLKSFRVRGEINRQAILPTKESINLMSAGEVYLVRPNKLYIRLLAANHNREFFYDGSTITLYANNENVYATEKAPATIDAMLDMIMKQYGLVFPMTDFLRADPYSTLMKDVQKSRVIGASMIGNVYTKQMLFQQKNIDWQLWVDESKTPFPRQLVITDKAVPGEPQFIIQMVKWEANPNIESTCFTFCAPANAKKISFLTMNPKPKPPVVAPKPKPKPKPHHRVRRPVRRCP